VTASNRLTIKSFVLLARDAFNRTNRHAVAMMFVRPSVRLSVWDGRALWSYGALKRGFKFTLDSPMFWAPDIKACPAVPKSLFPVPSGREVRYGRAN